MSSLIVEICKIYKIEKHPNADRLSIVTINNESGWNCIVGLDQYKPEDLVVFIPPDCIVPPAIIEKYNLEYLKHNGRTGTVKLRGYISQGLVLEIPPGNWKLGDNVAEVMGITKYEPLESTYSIKSNSNQVSKRKLNPFFDKYTEIENIKNFGGIFKDGERVVVTEKIHGTNSRFALLPLTYSSKLPFFDKIKFLWNKYILHKDYEFVYGSHNVQLTGATKKNNFYGDNVWGRVAAKYDLINHIEKDMIIYGEIYGNGIQDLTYGLKDIDLRIFDIKQKGTYLNWPDVEMFCVAHGLKTVPIIAYGEPFCAEKLREWTDGKSLLYPEQIREGIVIKPMIEENNPRIGRKILKSVSVDYLTRKNGTEFK